MKSLVVFAHADDETLGMGGTIMKRLALGEQFYTMLMAKEDGHDGRQSLGHMADAFKVLGLEIDRCAFGPYPDQRFEAYPVSDLANSVARVVDHVQPDTVWTHWIGDLNRDHRLTAEAVLVACRPHKFPCVRRILSFEVPSATEWAPWEAFKPNWFETLTEEWLASKKDAFAKYPTEFVPWPHPRSYLALEKRAAHWASVAGTQPYAEAFHLVRRIQ
jgi:N-acetylglucosamine malate deacetylase 1